MKRNKNKKHDALIFAGTLVIILLILIGTVIKTNVYNAARHTTVFSIEEIERCRGKQFDPKVADVMISLIRNDELNTD